MKRLLVLIMLGACIGTETGNPPLTPVELDPDLLSYSEDGINVEVVGAVGAVIPGGAEIQLTPLDGAPAFRVFSEFDGSFRLEHPFTNEVRLQAIEGRSRSQIVDHRFLNGVLTAACKPITDVDFVRIEGEPGANAIGYVSVEWPCGNPPSADLLYGDTGLSVEGSFTTEIQSERPTTSQTLAITFDGREGEVEDHILITNGESRTIVTVVAEACGSECAL